MLSQHFKKERRGKKQDKPLNSRSDISKDTVGESWGCTWWHTKVHQGKIMEKLSRKLRNSHKDLQKYVNFDILRIHKKDHSDKVLRHKQTACFTIIARQPIRSPIEPIRKGQPKGQTPKQGLSLPNHLSSACQMFRDGMWLWPKCDTWTFYEVGGGGGLHVLWLATHVGFLRKTSIIGQHARVKLAGMSQYFVQFPSA